MNNLIVLIGTAIALLIMNSSFITAEVNMIQDCKTKAVVKKPDSSVYFIAVAIVLMIAASVANIAAANMA